MPDLERLMPRTAKALTQIEIALEEMRARFHASVEMGVQVTKERDEALAKIRTLTELFEKLSQDDEKVRIIGVLNEALRFYADPEIYFALMVAADPPCGDFINDFSDDHGHPQLDGNRYGKKARAALREAFGDLWAEKND